VPPASNAVAHLLSDENWFTRFFLFSAHQVSCFKIEDDWWLRVFFLLFKKVFRVNLHTRKEFRLQAYTRVSSECDLPCSGLSVCKVQVINFRDTGVPHLYAALHNLNSASSLDPVTCHERDKEFLPCGWKWARFKHDQTIYFKIKCLLSSANCAYIHLWLGRTSLSLCTVQRARSQHWDFCVQNVMSSRGHAYE